MRKSHRTSTLGIIGFLGLTLALTAACTNGVSQANPGAGKPQLAAEQQNATSVHQQPPTKGQNEVAPFALHVETLTSDAQPSKYGLAPISPCVPSGVSKRGQRIDWRFEINDTATGKRVTDKDGVTVTIRIPGADDVTGRFSQSPGGAGMPDRPWMWTAGWVSPPDYPLGGLDYSIVITSKDGKSFAWNPLVQTSASNINSRIQILD